MVSRAIDIRALAELSRAQAWLLKEQRLPTAYKLLMQRCGLSQAEAAELHEVGLDTVKSWCAGRNPAPAAALAELRQLHLAISLAATRLAEKAIKRLRGGTIELGTVDDDRAALALGFPCVGAHEAALGLALALMGDVTVVFRPHARGVLTASVGASRSR
jgi:DNA-binding transcriptional regulator YiaG